MGAVDLCVNYRPEACFWSCAQILKVASKINERYSGKFQDHITLLTCVTMNWFQNANLMTIYLLNVNNRSTRTRCDVYLVSLSLTLNILHALF